MATVTPVSAGNPRANLGTFRVGVFNLFEEVDRERYEELRSKGNDKSSGVKLEKLREFTKRTEVIEGGGENKLITKTEELYVIVEYWEKSNKTKENGDGKEDTESARDALVGR